MDIAYQKTLPVRYDVDVFVAGGGPAGVAAAVSCARQGRRVFLAEGFGAFGGAAVTMLVPIFMPFGDRRQFLAEGIGREVYDRLRQAALPRWQPYCPNGIPAETLKSVYDTMVEDAGVSFLFHCQVLDAVVEDGAIRYVICAAKGGTFAVHANVFIDCTGDGDLAAYAGAGIAYGDEQERTMATTLCGLWTGIDWSRKTGLDSDPIEQAIADGVFTNHDRHLPGICPLAEETCDETGRHRPDGIGGSNAGHIYGVDARDPASLTKGIIAGRRQLPEYRRYYREYVPGFEQAELVATAPFLGIRESRRVVCDYTLVLEDFKRQAVFEDEIGRFNYCIDIHSPTNDAEGYQHFIAEHHSLRYKDGESYGIPYRSLAVQGLRNLLVAGRCIGTDRHMQSSVRVMPGCYITGQAAGIAAAVVCDAHSDDVHRADVREIQSRLIGMNAYLPHFHP